MTVWRVWEIRKIPVQEEFVRGYCGQICISPPTVGKKFQFTAGSFPEFIDQYIAGVERTMNNLGRLLDNSNPYGCSFNFYYYHLLMQVRLYYPNAEKKIADIFKQNYQLWESAIQRAKENGEIRQDVDVEEAASMFWQVFFGISFEQSFLQGLNIKQLAKKLHFIYSLIKA